MPVSPDRVLGAVLFCILPATPLTAQRLVVPTPDSAAVPVQVEPFVGSDGANRRIDLYRPPSRTTPAPAVVFVNVIGPGLRTWPGYQDWARLVASRGFVGVLYEAPERRAELSEAANQQAVASTLDSLLVTLARRAAEFGIEAGNVVLWAGSANTRLGTPAALEAGARPVSGYVLYYGAGPVTDPRRDVPVFIARAGLDAPGLNRSLDSLSARLISAGVAVTVVNYPAGRHGFDVSDRTAMSAEVIEQTIAFMGRSTTAGVRQSLHDGVAEATAAAAFAAGRWDEAVSRYQLVADQNPSRGGTFWRLGLAHLEQGNPRAALSSFERARTLGVSGARDIGLPAARAAVRVRDETAAVAWIRWALERFPPIRAEVAADRELAALLEHPDLRGG